MMRDAYMATVGGYAPPLLLAKQMCYFYHYNPFGAPLRTCAELYRVQGDYIAIYVCRANYKKQIQYILFGGFALTRTGI